MAQRPTSRAKPKAKAVAKKPSAAKAEAAPVKAKAAAKAPPAKTAAPTKALRAKATKAAAKPAARKAPATPKAKAAPPKAVAKAAPAKAALAQVNTRGAGKAATKAKVVKPLAAKPAKQSAKRAVNPAKPPKQPPYLAAELGQPTDHKGEPVGAGQAAVRSDEALQDYTLQLWRQMQSGRVVHRYMRTMERAGLTADEVWTAGLAGEARATSSTPDEMRRYRQKVLFRANLLEAILSETVADLRRLDGIEPTPPATTGGAASKSA